MKKFINPRKSNFYNSFHISLLFCLENFNSISIAVETLDNIDGIISEYFNSINPSIISNLKKNKIVSLEYNNQIKNLHLISKKSFNSHGSIVLASFVTINFLEKLNKSYKNIIYIPWTDDEITYAQNNGFSSL